MSEAEKMAKRGSGRTSRQIAESPHMAVYVYAGPRVYTERLCRHLGRADLCLVPFDAGAITGITRGWRGAIVVDHAACDTSGLSWHQRHAALEEIEYCRQYMRPPNDAAKAAIEEKPSHPPRNAAG